MSYLGKDCFNNCTNLTSITILSSIDRMGQYILWDCKKLKKMEIPFLFTMNTKKIIFGDTVLNEIVIPTSLEYINNEKINIKEEKIKLNIPTNVTGLGSYCFTDCQHISEIKIPETISYWGYKCFYKSGNISIKGKLPQYVIDEMNEN